LTIANTLAQSDLTPAQIVAIVFVLSGLAFKISAAPFHMWTPDVYQGASTPVTALFAMAPKAAAVAVLCRLVTGPLSPVFDQVQQVIIALSIASLVIGSFAGIAQNNAKRLMAYSSIGHMGFVIMALCAAGPNGVQAAFFYVALYIIMSAVAFAVLLAVYDRAEGNEKLSHLSGLAKRSPLLAFAMATTLLSMAGIPPLVGFFGKFLVFRAALDEGLVTLVVLGVVASVVAAFYYLRLIKIMYFDAVKEDAPDLLASPILNTIAVVGSIFLIALLIYPVALSNLSQWVVIGL
jgi:NADH-quinone oxidoreductase subunit N